jgi:hypothetical protein
MKRLHIHVSVDNLPASIRFYSALFAAEPSVTQSDYAKWMLDDPRMNFAISQRGRAKGLDHLGIQAESAEELTELGRRMQAAELPQLTQTGASCCYAKSDKHWSVDPNGIPWETFHTLDTIPTFGADTRESIEEQVGSAKPASACCSQTPAQKAASKLVAAMTGSSCC